MFHLKVLERVVYDRVFDKIFNPNFSLAIWKKNSCLQQLLMFLNDILESFHDNTQVDTVDFEFCKAFD